MLNGVENGQSTALLADSAAKKRHKPMVIFVKINPLHKPTLVVMPANTSRYLINLSRIALECRTWEPIIPGLNSNRLIVIGVSGRLVESKVGIPAR